MDHKITKVACKTLAMLMISFSANSASLVVNGGFEQLTGKTGDEGQLGYNMNASGWNATGYNFLFPSGSADTTGVTGQHGYLELWGPNNGSNNGLTASSPDGGNFVANDGAYQSGPISQTINGLTVGKAYTLNFWSAAAQQQGYTGDTTDIWKVDFGSDTQYSTLVNLPSHGFSGWVLNTMNFTASSSSQLLSFLAIGTPSGVPPFALIDGVSLEETKTTPTPIPGVAALFGIGLVRLVSYRRKRS
ncbi:hypothetical protein JCM14076_00370 [Methylosoma difficile]